MNAAILQAWVPHRSLAGRTCFLVIDLCSGWESMLATGLRLFRLQMGGSWSASRRTRRHGSRKAAGAHGWRHVESVLELAYGSFDNDERLQPHVLADLAEESLDDVLLQAVELAGWSGMDGSTVAVLFNFSPPCQTWSWMKLGTCSGRGPAVRLGREMGYRPVTGKAGAEARAVDRLVRRWLPMLHAAAAASDW